jgi:murein DD-endopeptidase MepM/ murein hydrolase activator NlpD
MRFFLLGLLVWLLPSRQTPGSWLLPFPLGDSARLIQGPGGRYGHQGALEFAWDFVMPIGSPVTAAGAGRVVAVESRFADGTRTPGEENYIFIDHGDSTFSRYYHLTTGGVRVAVGDQVAAGDTIGASGNSGASAGPHLHFDVTRGCPQFGCQTISIRFANADPHSMSEGQVVRALRP